MTRIGAAYTGAIGELMASITGRLRGEPALRQQLDKLDIEGLCAAIAGARAASTTLPAADALLDRFDGLDREGRLAFFRLLRDAYTVDADAALTAAQAYHAQRDTGSLKELLRVTEPGRQTLLRRLNISPGGTARLVRMRAELLREMKDSPDLEEVDLDFAHLFTSWFNGGFLKLRRIDWNTPAAILGKIVDYEAVHKIRDWDDLRGRIDPRDRRLYAFFHPQMPGEPLIFVEVALTREVPHRISDIIADARDQIHPDEAQVAVFYSISNCQAGLRGVSFGNLLIKSVVAELRAELPALERFVTLSPVPSLAKWIRAQSSEADGTLAQAAQRALSLTDREGWQSGDRAEEARRLLRGLAAAYLAAPPARREWAMDPVARFHIGNGASLHEVSWPGDTASTAMEASFGVMVNYDYRLRDITANSEAFVERDIVAVSPGVANLAASALRSSGVSVGD